MKLGLNDVTTIYLGSAEVEEIYLGTELVYSGGTPPPPHDYSKDYLTMDILSGGTIVWTAPNSSYTRSIQYSIDDGQTWNSRISSTGGTLVANVNAGDKVLLKGNKAFYGNNAGGNGFSASTASFNLQGNIMSLISGDSFSSVTTFTTDYVFKQMFKETKVINAENLILPATTVTRYCYQSMFQNCTSLLTAPELPATASTETSSLCYNAMFRGCTSLVKAPSVLPSFNIGSYCFANMFRDCTSLVVPPAYLGTSTDTVPTSGAVGMFYGCTSLTTAPELPAATVQQNSYTDMFNGCSSLSSITCLATSVDSYGTTNWTNGVAATGTFVKAENMTGWTTGASGIPNGWTVQDYSYTFTFADSSTSKSETPSSASTSYTYANIVSERYDGTSPVYSITSAPAWANASLSDNTLTIAVQQNDSYEREGSVELTQDGSGKHLTVSLAQAGEEKPYLTFNILSGGTINWYCPKSTWISPTTPRTISYKLNNGAWTDITATSAGTSFNVSAGDVVKFKGDNSSYAANTSDYNSFSSSTAYFDIEGNIMSLIDSENFMTATTLTDGYAFFNLFANTNVANAEDLILPATSLAGSCYRSMFSNCRSLATAPSLPATTMATSGYSSMFQGCTSLTSAPVLSATTLAQGCYSNMFNGCSSLTTAPQLPATTLAQSCYGSMFRGCTNLTTVTSSIGNSSTIMSVSACTNMFSDCTSLVAAPALPSTTLNNGCYGSMFDGCTSLTTAPELPATSLNANCYLSMFQGCTSLTTAPELPATTLGLNPSCYNSMFRNCTSLTIAPELPATILDNACYRYMFAGCSSLTTAPSVLPVTRLTGNCYSYMFQGCTSLTTAPALPATTLAEGCYQYMFYGCTNLNSITCLATDISASNCTNNWTNGVAATGTFTKAASMADWTTGVNGIPDGWAVTDYSE